MFPKKKVNNLLFQTIRQSIFLSVCDTFDLSANKPESFTITGTYQLNEQKIKLLMRKEVYFYEYMDSLGRFDETHLTTKKLFYSKLNNTDINDDDYKHAKIV